MIIWLLRMLTHGKNSEVYNLGSDQSVSLSELANEIVSLSNSKYPFKRLIQYRILGERNSKIKYYVPDITKSRQDLQLSLNVSLREALSRTFGYYLSLKEKVEKYP